MGHYVFLSKAVTAAREGRLASAALNRYGQFQQQRSDDAMRRFMGLPRASEVSIYADIKSSPQAQAQHTEFERARYQASLLPQNVRDIEGMSGQRYRAFINHLLSELLGPRNRILERINPVRSAA